MEMEKGKKFNVGEIKGNRSYDIGELYSFLKAHALILISWGFNKPTVVKKDEVFRFNVQGHHHNGYVYIILDFSDTFTIVYTSTQNTIRKISEGIYIDQLIEVLDTEIEYIPAYK